MAFAIVFVSGLDLVGVDMTGVDWVVVAGLVVHDWFV